VQAEAILRGVLILGGVGLAFGVLVAVLIAALPIAGPIVDYGAEGWLWALFGLCQRTYVDSRSASPGGATSANVVTMRILAGLVPAIVYVWQEQGEYSFPPICLLVVILGVGVMSAGLLLFRRGPSRCQPPEPASEVLRFIGRHTLEIYAIQLAGSELIILLVPSLAPRTPWQYCAYPAGAPSPMLPAGRELARPRMVQVPGPRPRGAPVGGPALPTRGPLRLMTRSKTPATFPGHLATAMRRTGLVLLIALGGIPAAAHAQTPRSPEPLPATGLSHLGTRAGAVRFRVQFSPPRELTAEIDGIPHRYPSWPGLSPVGPPGDPAVPAEIVRVAVPARGSITLQVTTVDGGPHHDIRFPAVRGIRNQDGGRRVTRTTPLPQVELLDVGFDRSVRVAVIAVRPVSWDPESGITSWASQVDVTVLVIGAASTGPGARKATPDEATRRSWSRTLLNPTDAPVFAVAAPDTLPPPGNGIPATWFDDADAWLKIEIEANGIYSLDRAALAAAGVPVDAIDPRTLRVFSGPLVPDVAWAALGWDSLATAVPDSFRLESAWRHVYERPGFVNGFGDPGGMEEIAIRVTGEADGRIDGGDRIVFHALGPDNYRDRYGLALDTPEDYFENPYTDRTIYWLGWGGTFPDAPRRMEIVDATPQPAAPLVTESTARAHGERNRIYSPTHQDPGRRWEQWFWEEMTSLAAGYIFRVPLPGAVPASPLEFHLRLWGVREPMEDGLDLEALHHVQVTVNDQDLGVTQWGSDTDPLLAFTAQDVTGSGVPFRNPAEFIFRLPDVPPFDPDRVDRVYLTWIDVTYRRSLDLAGNTGELPLDGGTPGRRARITSLPPGAGLEVFDVTDLRNPRLLTGAAAAGTEAELSFDRPGSAV